MRITFIGLDSFTKLTARGRCMNKRITILTMFILIAMIITASFGAAGTFSGRIWNDINWDGIQDVGEPPMSNFPILVYDESYFASGCHIVFTNYTDSTGYYEFSHSKLN